MKYEPLFDNVLVRRLTPQQQHGNILIPETVQEPQFKAEVVAVGPGRVNPTSGVMEPVPVEPGDIVMFGKYAGHHVEINGEPYLVLRVADLFCRVVPGSM